MVSRRLLRQTQTGSVEEENDDENKARIERKGSGKICKQSPAMVCFTARMFLPAAPHSRRRSRVIRSFKSASAQQLADDPWSRARRSVPDYGAPSRFEKNVVRTLSNPNGEPRTQHARTPHHLLNGTITPNGLHFVISHAGDPDIDPDKHRLVIHGLVKQPLVFTLDALARYPMVSRMAFVECGGNSAPLFSKEPIQANVQALHGLVSCAEWTGVKLSTLLEETGVDPKAKWLIAEGADSPAREPQRAADQGAGRRHDRALPERRAAHAGQRLSDAAAPARLGRQHEHQMSAAASSSPNSPP